MEIVDPNAMAAWGTLVMLEVIICKPAWHINYSPVSRWRVAISKVSPRGPVIPTGFGLVRYCWSAPAGKSTHIVVLPRTCHESNHCGR